MNMGEEKSEVVNNVEDSRFELRVGDHLAYIDYTLKKDRIVYIHTEVPQALEGQGVGSRLAQHALTYAQEQDLRVILQCPFVAAYIKRHPENQKLVS